MSSSVIQYLRSGTILISHSPTYDNKGRQLPFQESPPQKRERHAFVKSLQWQRNVTSWMHDQQHPHPAAAPAHSPSPSSSESSSPRTPASPLNTAHTRPDINISYDEKMKQQTISALDAELAKLILASRQIAPPRHRQSRNYKNLHLPNTTIPRDQQKPLAGSQLKRSQAPAAAPSRGVFDSPSYPESSSSYPSMDHTSADEELDSGEPYIFYSSSSSSSFSTTPCSSTSTNADAPMTKPRVAGIGEFPYPSPTSSRPSHMRSLSLNSPAPLISSSSSSSPRNLTPPSLLAGSTTQSR